MSIFTPRVPNILATKLDELIRHESQHHKETIDTLIAMESLEAARHKGTSARLDDLRDYLAQRLDRQDELLLKIYYLSAPGEAVFFELEFTNLTTGETRIFENGETATMILPRNSTIGFLVRLWDSEDVATRNAAVLDGAATVNLTNPAGTLVDVAPDGLSGKITSGAAAGIGLLTIEGDAKIGEGVKPLIVTADINIPPGEAVVAEVVFDTPVDNPTA